MTGISYQLTRAGFSTLFGGASLYLAAAARQLIVGQREWIKSGTVVDGTVRAIDQVGTVHDAVRRKLYAPVVEFSTAEGEHRQFTSALSSEDANRFAVGQRVKVRYLRDNLARVDLDQLTGLWWPAAALVVATVVCAVIALLPFVLSPSS